MTNEWIYNNEIFNDNDKNVRGIVYEMTYNNKKYVGKKVIRDNKQKSLNWKDYRGSSKNWKEFIKDNEDKVTLKILYLCANKAEMHYWESFTLYSTHAIFNDEYFNGNVDMIVNTRNSKNFINKPNP